MLWRTLRFFTSFQPGVRKVILDRAAFDLRQHEMLRADIQVLEIEGRRLDAAAVAAIAALWAWALKDGNLEPWRAGAIASAIAVASGLKAIAMSRLIFRKGEYIQRIEAVHSGIGGFENWFHTRRPWSVFWVPLLIFVGMMAGSMAAMFIVPRPRPAQTEFNVKIVIPQKVAADPAAAAKGILPGVRH